jgi:hypothetical protein
MFGQNSHLLVLVSDQAKMIATVPAYEFIQMLSEALHVYLRDARELPDPSWAGTLLRYPTNIPHADRCI